MLAGNHFSEAGFLNWANERIVIPVYVNVGIVLQFVLLCYFFFYLKTGDKFKTYSGIILSLLCWSKGKFKLRLYNEFLLVLIWIQTTYIARYSVVKLITLIKLFRNKPISKSNHLSAYFNQKPKQIEFNEIVHNFANQFF